MERLNRETKDHTIFLGTEEGGTITKSQSDHQNDPRNNSNTRYLCPSLWDGYSIVGIPSNPRATLHTDRINRDKAKLAPVTCNQGYTGAKGIHLKQGGP